MTLFKGQTENAGHFLQPATTAIGHTVMTLLHRELGLHPAKRKDAHQRHCVRASPPTQTINLILSIAIARSMACYNRRTFSSDRTSQPEFERRLMIHALRGHDEQLLDQNAMCLRAVEYFCVNGPL
jgi:hypothetical protein